ncbi:MAG: hypothetical protein V5A88_08640 [Candidatus Thermoplasmatota archaeon]
MDEKIMIGTIVAIVAVILLAVTFVTPWYNVSMESSGDGGGGEFSSDMYFTEVETTTNGNTETEDYEDGSEFESVMNLTRIFTVVAVIGSVIGLMGALLVGLGKLDKKIGAFLAIIGVIFAFVAPLYMMVDLPNAFDEEAGSVYGDEGPHESFFGSSTEEEMGTEIETSWGPSVAWYLALVAGVLNIIVLVLVFLSSPASASQPEGGYYQQQPGQQRGAAGGPQQQQQPQQQQPTGGGAEETANTCPTCNQELRYIEDYDRWYCDNCQEYK